MLKGVWYDDLYENVVKCYFSYIIFPINDLSKNILYIIWIFYIY